MDQDYAQKLDELHRGIVAIKNPSIRRDLTTMYRHCLDIQSQLSMESVNCRRLHKVTPKYSEIAKKLEQSIQNLDDYLVYGILSKD